MRYTFSAATNKAIFSSLFFSSINDLHFRRGRHPDGPAHRRQCDITSFILSSIILASNRTKTTKIVCDTLNPATNPNIRNLSSFRPHSRALQFQYFITAVECYRNSLESDRAPLITAPLPVLHRDHAWRSNGTSLPLSGKRSE